MKTKGKSLTQVQWWRIEPATYLMASLPSFRFSDLTPQTPDWHCFFSEYRLSVFVFSVLITFWCCSHSMWSRVCVTIWCLSVRPSVRLLIPAWVTLPNATAANFAVVGPADGRCRSIASSTQQHSVQQQMHAVSCWDMRYKDRHRRVCCWLRVLNYVGFCRFVSERHVGCIAGTGHSRSRSVVALVRSTSSPCTFCVAWWVASRSQPSLST